jgi:DNA-binding transcriptional ArsR family regulator
VPEVIVGVVGGDDDLESAATAIGADEVGTVAMDEHRDTGVAERDEEEDGSGQTRDCSSLTSHARRCLGTDPNSKCAIAYDITTEGAPGNPSGSWRKARGRPGLRSQARLQQVTLLTRDNRVTYKEGVHNEDLVFKALADATRRLLLDKLFERDGMTLGELEAEVPELTRFGVMKHLGVLEQAGLVVTRKQGRHKLHYLNAVPIRLLLERWIDKYRDRRAAALLDLKDHLEGTK